LRAAYHLAFPVARDYVSEPDSDGKVERGMKSYKPEDVRVVGLFGHRGAGKTMLAESLLFTAGATSRMGSVDAGNLLLEIDEVATERHITMAANVGFVEWNGVRVGLIDTPGDGTFWGATNRALQVVDAGLVVVSATDGVETIAGRAIGVLKERNTPFAVVITKLDKDVAEFAGTIEEIKKESGVDTVALSVPMGKGAAIKGVVSLLSQKAYVDDGAGKPKEVDVPADMAGEVTKAREMLFDAVAAADDALAEKYLEEGSLSEQDLANGLRAAFLKGNLIPALAAVPSANLGSRVVLDVVKAIFPAPIDRPALKAWKNSKQDTQVERRPDPNGPLVAQVFRTYNDPFAGSLSYARVWSGTLKAGTDFYNTSKDTSDRPSHMYLPQGGTKQGAEVKEATVGDLVVLTKLKWGSTGDVFAQKDDTTWLPAFTEPDVLLHVGLTAKEQKDEDKVAQLIHKLVGEDPSLRFERDEATKEPLLGGQGQTHIDYVVERLRKTGVEVIQREPKVPYRETLRTPVMNIEGKHKKQTGGHGQFAVCYINVEPQPRGTGNEFVDAIVGGSIPRNFIPSVEKGVVDALKRGPISGSELVDIKVTLFDGKFHRVDSSDMAFQTAARKGMKAVFANAKARPVLLEPYMKMEITCPAETVGDIMGDLNSRRARVSDMTTEGKRGKVTCSVPMNEVLRYANVLKSITSGRGSFTMQFDRYEEAPSNVQEQVAAQYKGGGEVEEENDD
jgi:elongation factor G